MDSLESNADLVERRATAKDEPWLWELYSQLLKEYIDEQWGWNEQSQRTNFKKHLPYTIFTIVEKNQRPIGAYAQITEKRRLYLHMLLVVPAHQRTGVGSSVLNSLKAHAKQCNYYLELSVFSSNPVAGFYQKNGFVEVESTPDKRLFRWHP